MFEIAERYRLSAPTAGTMADWEGVTGATLVAEHTLFTEAAP